MVNPIPGSQPLCTPSIAPQEISKKNRYLDCFQEIVQAQTECIQARIGLLDRAVCFTIGSLLGGLVGIALKVHVISVICLLTLSASSALFLAWKGPFFMNKTFPRASLREELAAIFKQRLMRLLASDLRLADAFDLPTSAIKASFSQTVGRIGCVLGEDLNEVGRYFPEAFLQGIADFTLAFYQESNKREKALLAKLKDQEHLITETGSHHASKKIIGEKSVYSSFFPYRLVEELVKLSIDKNEINADNVSKDKLINLLKKFKEDLEAPFEFEREHLTSLKDKTRAPSKFSWITKMLGPFRSYRSSTKVDQLSEGEHPIIWHRKRARWFEAHDRDANRLVYHVLKYLYVKDNRTEIRIGRVLDALFLKDPDRPDDQQEFRDIQDSKKAYFTDLISFIFEQTEVVHLILDCPIEPKNMVDLERKILAVWKRLSNDETFEAKTLNIAIGLLQNNELSYEVDILTSGRF